MLSRRTLVPDSNKFIYAMLDWASKQGEFHRSEAMSAMVEYFGLEEAARRERTADLRDLRYKSFTNHAISNLKNAGLLVWKGPGRYVITDLGRSELEASDGVMTHWYLRQKMGR